MLELAIMVFDHPSGADHAYADVLGDSGDAPWMHEIALVEHHRHDRIVVRGTFAGRYVDIDEEGDVIGKRTAEGALTGAVVGAIFGPPGFAAGIVAGGATGGMAEGRGGRLVRRPLSAEAARDLERAVAGSPRAAPDPAA